MSIVVELGNPKPLDAKAAKGGEERVTVIKIPDGTPLGESLATITAREGVWRYQAEEGTKPTWVESSSDALELVLSEHYGCPIGRKKGKSK